MKGLTLILAVLAGTTQALPAAPHLGPCLTAGQQVKFSKTVLSGLLAEVLYRVATAGAPPAAGKD